MNELRLSDTYRMLSIDNKALINKLKQRKNVVYTHLVLERIEQLEKELNELKGALK